MSRRAQVTLVVGGFVAAVVAGYVAAVLYDARVAKLPYDTSGGMYAGGQLLTSLAAFCAVALVPTLLALWFLRRHERFWNAVAVASVAFAIAGLVAVLTPLVVPDTQHIAPLFMSLLGIAQLLGAPLWFMAFVLFAILAPSPRTRRKLVMAATIEVVIGVFALVHWFVPAARL